MQAISQITEKKPQLSEAHELDSKQNGSYEDSEIESAFDGLTDKQRLIGANINRLQSQRFQPSLERDALLLKIWDFEPVLSDIPIWALDYCFVEAMKLHRSEFPVQANEISRIWLEMGESTRAELFEKTNIKALPKGDCEWCNGFGRMRVKVTVNGKDRSYTPVKWASSEDTNTMDVCYCKKS
jgi:hypothetical protein